MMSIQIRKWIKEKRERISGRKIVYPIILFCLPFFAALLMCLLQNISLGSVYLPNSQWNDEVFYFKQVEGIREFGIPQGYFGYNEQHAVSLTFGTWSPVSYMIYALWAKLFGWNYLSPIWCNLFLMSIALGVLAIEARLNGRQTAVFAGFYLLFTPITRYALSGMVENMTWCLVILFAAFWIREAERPEHRKQMRLCIGMYILAAFLTLMRPYYVLFMLVPGYFSYLQKKKIRNWAVCAIVMVMAMSAYFLISTYFCAPYFFQSIRTTTYIEGLLSNFKGTILELVQVFRNSARRFLMLTKEGITGSTMFGGWCALSICLFVWLIYQTCTAKREERMRWIYLMASSILLLAAILLCYSIDYGSRHLVGFILVILVMAARYDYKSIRTLMIALVLLWLFVIKTDNAEHYQLPVKEDWRVAEIESGREQLMSVMLIEENASSPWENTVIWDLGEDNETCWQNLYAFPDGIGINCCKNVFILDNFDGLQSKYLLTNVGGNVDLRCASEEKRLLAEFGQVHVWQLR